MSGKRMLAIERCHEEPDRASMGRECVSSAERPQCYKCEPEELETQWRQGHCLVSTEGPGRRTSEIREGKHPK